ncbi:MAG: hypothetical protein ABFS02_02450 [Pseudomonadota bacterium]
MTESVLEIRVACYGGYRGEEEPRRLWFDDRAVEVAEILDRWLAPEHRYFKIRGDDGYTYIVRHDTQSGHWELTMFDRTGIRGRP